MTEEDELVITDGRQSEQAAAVQRGTCRMLRAMGLATLTELPLANGRRADIAALDRKGRCHDYRNQVFHCGFQG